MNQYAEHAVRSIDSHIIAETRSTLANLAQLLFKLRGDPCFPRFQATLARVGAVRSLIQFLRSGPSTHLPPGLLALGILLENNVENQKAAMESGVVRLLVDTLRGVTPAEKGADAEKAATSMQQAVSSSETLLGCALICMGRAINGNAATAREAVAQGVAQPLSQLVASTFLSKPALMAVHSLLKQLVGLLGEIPEELASNLWTLLGAEAQTISVESAQSLSVLAKALQEAPSAFVTAFLEAGATCAIESVLRTATSDENHHLSAEVKADCARLLLALSRESEGLAYLRAALCPDTLCALCEASADGAEDHDDDEGSAWEEAAEELVLRLLSCNDTCFLVRLFQAPGCMAALMSSPRLSAATLDAASSWALQLRLVLDASACSSVDILAASIPLALLAPHYGRCAKALLKGRCLDVLVATLMQELSSVSLLSSIDIDRPSSSTAVRRRGEVALAVTTLSKWLAQSASCCGALKRKAPILCDDTSPRKRMRGQAMPTNEDHVCFVVGGERLETSLGNVSGLSSVLDGLLETVGNCRGTEINIPCPAGLTICAMQTGMRHLLELASQGRTSHALGVTVNANSALELWQLADFLNISHLQSASEPAVADGFAGDGKLWMAAFNIAVGHSHQRGLLRVCMAHLASDMLNGIACGNLIELARGAHRGLVREELVAEFHRMLGAAVKR